MAVIECPECKKEMAGEAQACTECGHPLLPDPKDLEKNEPSLPKASESKPAKKKTSWVLIVLLAVVGVLAYTQLTIFMIPPIGAVPEGRTLIISRMNKTNFIDSPDAMCERIQGGVNLICRAMTMAAIGEKATIYLRLPYFEPLYQLSTGGKTYSQGQPAQTAAAAEPVTTTPTDAPAAAAPPSDDPKEMVVAVVRNWQDIKRHAFVDKDSSQLATVLTGKALEETEGGVNWWKNNGTFNAIELHSLDVVNVDVLSPTQAKVVATISETKDNSVQGRKSSTYDATYTLEKEGDTWHISNMEAGAASSVSNEAPPAPVAPVETAAVQEAKTTTKSCKGWAFYSESRTGQIMGLIATTVPTKEACEENRAIFEPGAAKISPECVCMD